MFVQDLSEPFARVMTCSVSELLLWLPVALPGARIEINAAAKHCGARFNGGTFALRRTVLSERRIGAVRLPQLHLHLSYQGLSRNERERAQRAFDRATQRGGG
ncbi:MAG: hypothetical protein KGL42_05400 [Betaproteobacteria bacterium]|nr:hypothetical protein [Betaproteobacteria bacterium]